MASLASLFVLRYSSLDYGVCTWIHLLYAPFFFTAASTLPFHHFVCFMSLRIFLLPHTASAVSMTLPLNFPHCLSTSSPFRCFALAIWYHSLAQNLIFPSFVLSLSLLSWQLLSFLFICSFHRQSLSSAPDGGHCQFLLSGSLSRHVQVTSHQRWWTLFLYPGMSTWTYEHAQVESCKI